MLEWVRVGPASDLPPDGIGMAVKVDGIGIAIFGMEGAVHAVEDLCPHMGFPLSEGVAQGGEVICSWHGWRISLVDGSCRRESARAKIFPCEVRDGDIWIEVDKL